MMKRQCANVAIATPNEISSLQMKHTRLLNWGHEPNKNSTEVRDLCATIEETTLRSRKKSLESLFVRLSDEEIAWIDKVVEMSGLSGSEIIETAIDAYLLIIVARQTLATPALPDFAAKPGRHYLVSERSRSLLRSVSDQGGWSQNTIVRLALMWLKGQLGPSADGGALTLATPGIRLDKDNSSQ